jgi:hypothetical protein
MVNIASQQFLEIDQIRESVVILKNKSLRGVMMVSSLNFALTSEEEQNAITYQFQNFLNSLDFSCQIITQTRKSNIAGYIEKIKELEKTQTNELLQVQTASYREFIEGLVGSGSIMTKSFFVVVPFYLLNAAPTSDPTKVLKATAVPKMTEDEFQRCKNQLWQRMEFLALGLKRCGLRATPLTTTELIELFWGLYHPQEAEVGFFPEIPPELSN